MGRKLRCVRAGLGRLTLWCAAVLLCLLPGAAAAQEFVEDDDRIRREVEALLDGAPGDALTPLERTADDDAAQARPSAVEATLRDTLRTALAGDAELIGAYRALLIADLERQRQVLEERRESIAWTNWISRIIFVVVHAVLALALRVALLEFRHARRTRAAVDAQSELSISLEGVALRTSLHGILLLVLALGFYFLYLRFVYPILEIGG